ncbi:MAG: hypothetical protein KGZ96_01385 [Clostridia bacterium]|nr:hypothetical protein [Clostridia bacterium]
MISLKVKSTSVNTLIKSYYLAVAIWFGLCPTCLNPYHRHDTYRRKTPYLFGPILIQRVYCNSCKKAHALLPCFIIPYARVLDVVREAAIKGICFNSHTMMRQGTVLVLSHFLFNSIIWILE